MDDKKLMTGEEYLEYLSRRDDRERRERAKRYDIILQAAQLIGEEKNKRLYSLSARIVAAKERHDDKELAKIKPVWTAETQQLWAIHQLSEFLIECIEDTGYEV